MNWLQTLNDYHENMGWNYDSDIQGIKTQKQAKARLKEDLEFIIGTNGYGELYESEKELCKQLNIKE
tara:strand:+ start:315 stop:515 length:201 start_codon:yes stop_codon:yes gene_type:complete